MHQINSFCTYLPLMFLSIQLPRQLARAVTLRTWRENRVIKCFEKFKSYALIFKGVKYKQNHNWLPGVYPITKKKETIYMLILRS